MQELTSDALDQLLEPYDACIAYTPLMGEPDWRKAPVPEQLRSIATPVTLAGTSDPESEAAKLSEKYAGRTVLLLIPGMEFDTTGTRHGRGGGWYDRFLANVPAEWLRAGVTLQRNFSADSLLRSPWDESMDLMLVQHQEDRWSAYDVRPRNTKGE